MEVNYLDLVEVGLSILLQFFQAKGSLVFLNRLQTVLTTWLKTLLSLYIIRYFILRITAALSLDEPEYLLIYLIIPVIHT